MRSSIFKLAIKSVVFYRKSSVSQIVIVFLLAAIITGSLFTGYSVRHSLKQKANEALGNTDLLISSGQRFVSASLAKRVADRLNENATAIFETEGYIQNFSTGATALKVSIYGVQNDFFAFNGGDSLEIPPGTVAINKRLAGNLNLNMGDELIIHFREPDPLPSNAPFAPSGKNDGSKVLKVSSVLNAGRSGNFSLGISQIVPNNVFINLTDLTMDTARVSNVNRILIRNSGGYNDSVFSNTVQELLTISDIGMSIRKSEKTGEPELISGRIFIDSLIVSRVMQRIPPSRPVITYLANSISLKGKSTPYSFVAAIPPQILDTLSNNDIVINEWLAHDIGAGTGDTLELSWYDPGGGKHLEEKVKSFIVRRVIGMDSPLSDPSFMPDFPGISGSTTCSGWDAGIPILLDNIRDKDEDYWNIYRGTPKAFISYSAGLIMWGNNFGPATSIRFPQSMDSSEVVRALSGSLDPSCSGITVANIRKSGKKAAETGTDFSSLFLSLGIFIILSCIILLSLAFSTYFDTRKEQMKTYRALGFKNMFIIEVMLIECLIIAVAGAIPGVFGGFLTNRFIIDLLNSVWKGAVQTDTISTWFGILPVMEGFAATIAITLILLFLKSATFINRLNKPETGRIHHGNPGRNLAGMIFTFLIAGLMVILSFLFKSSSTMFSFIGGAIIFAAFILTLRQYYLKDVYLTENSRQKLNNYSRKFYSFHSSLALTPAIFIAAGIFSVIVTGANRQVLNNRMLLPSGGTGGYLLWIETALPVVQNLNSPSGRSEFGLDEPDLKDLKFIQSGKVAGDDASCLNLNHVSSPPLLGVPPEEFISKGSFSFVTRMKNQNPWSLLGNNPTSNTVYGVADQTVLQWGLKISTGDTLKYRTETGQPLDIIIAGGLKSSVFQGYILISESNITKYFPSVGSSVFLADGNREKSDHYIKILSERLSGYGASVETAGEKLASFFEVTNTYLNVFSILGVFGMVLGIAGMGFILLRNYTLRKREFALMIATGYSVEKIRRLLIKDHVLILLCGVITGSISGMISTLPSLLGGSEIPWRIIVFMIVSVAFIGTAALLIAIRGVKGRALVTQLRKE